MANKKRHIYPSKVVVEFDCPRCEAPGSNRNPILNCYEDDVDRSNNDVDFFAHGYSVRCPECGFAFEVEVI